MIQFLFSISSHSLTSAGGEGCWIVVAVAPLWAKFNFDEQEFRTKAAATQRDATAIIPPRADNFRPDGRHTPQQKELLSLSDSLLAELEQADEYVIGAPMHNFGVPSVLKLWIDQIARVGLTFSYGEGGPKGLIAGKKATFIIATGGIYDAQTRMASFNFVEPYLRAVFGFLGVTDATFLTAGGTSALNQGKDWNASLAPHLQAVQTHAQTI